MKKRLAFVLCTTSNGMFALGNVLIGLKRHLKLDASLFDIVIYVDKIENRDKNALMLIHQDIKIVYYKSAFSKKFLNSPSAMNWTVMAYARFECFSLLKEYQSVFYLDTDVLVQKDISEILKYNESDFYATFQDDLISEKIDGKFWTKNVLDEHSKYDLSKKEFITCSLLFNDSIKNLDDIKKWCYEKSELWLSNDQTILNIAMQKFNLDVRDLTSKYSFFANSQDANGLENASITHAAWSPKFWTGLKNAEWESNNKQWVLLGGTAYDPEYVETKRKLINKIVWFIPMPRLRDSVRIKLARRLGFRWLF